MIGFLVRFLGPIALLGVAYLWVSHHFESIGAGKAVVACNKKIDAINGAITRGQAETIATAKADAAAMSQSSEKVGSAVATDNAKTPAAVASAQSEIHDELAKPGGPAVAAPSFDLGGVSTPLNRLVDSAVGEADAADSARRAGETGAT